MDVERLNFHHLRYFWAVAREGNLTRAAARLGVAQSALSAQIRELEQQLGRELFRREGRGLVLSEAGELALGHADEIFASGRALLATLERGRARSDVLRVGAEATLSRNFQVSFVSPLFEPGSLEASGPRLRLESGALGALVERLLRRELDLVLANHAPSSASTPEAGRVRCQRLARQAVSIVGSARVRGFRFPRDVAGASMILPGPESELRREFDALCAALGVEVRVLAEVDDMASLRLFSRDARALALVPTVVVRDELRAGLLFEHCVVPGLFETFYALTLERAFPHPAVAELLARGEREVLAMGRARGRASSHEPR